MSSTYCKKKNEEKPLHTEYHRLITYVCEWLEAIAETTTSTN